MTLTHRTELYQNHATAKTLPMEMLTTVPWAPTETAYRRIATKSASKRKKRSLNAEEGGGEGEKEGRNVSGTTGGKGDKRQYHHTPPQLGTPNKKGADMKLSRTNPSSVA